MVLLIMHYFWTGNYCTGLAACAGFHGGNAHDLQTTALHAEGARGREELEKALLGLAARGEGRNAASLSVTPLLTCREDKAFLFNFHGAPEMSELGKYGFQKPSWLIFVTSAGAHMAKVCGIPHAFPYLSSLQRRAN